MAIAENYHTLVVLRRLYTRNQIVKYDCSLFQIS